MSRDDGKEKRSGYLSDYRKIFGRGEVKAEVEDMSRKGDISLVSRLQNLACGCFNMAEY